MVKNSRFVAAICLIFFFLSTQLLAQEKRVVGILPFTNNGSAEGNWVGRGVEEILFDKYSNLKNVDVFERETLSRLLTKYNVTDQASLTVRKAFSIGKETGVEVLLTGNYLLNGNELNLAFRLISTYTGGDIFRKTYSGPVENIFQLHEQAILDMLDKMKVTADESDRTMLARSSTGSIQAFQFYCQAYTEFQKGATIDVVANKFIQAINLDPDFWEAHYNLGVIYYNFDKYDLAIQKFETVINKNPSFYKPFYGLGVIHYLQRKDREAIRNFEKAISFKPDYDRSYYYLGRIYLRLDSIPKALENLKKSAEINPNYAPAQYQIGIANFRRGWYKSAIGAFKKSLQLYPENARAHNALGECYYILQRFDDALFHYNKAIELRPDYSTAYFNLGNATYKKGALQEIVDAYLEILETRYTKIAEENSNIRIADDLRELQDKENGKSTEVYTKMIESYKNALKYENSFFEAAYNLALTYDNIGKQDSAEFYYRESLKYNPELVRGYMRLGRLYEKQKKFKEALEAFKNVVKIEPSYFADTPRLGEEYRYLNIIENVLKEYQNKNKNNPNDPETLLVIARIFNSLGRLGQAEQYYQQIVQIDPRNREANLELRHLKIQLKKM